MKRIWHHFESWEEYKAGMWRDVPKREREPMIEAAIKFTGDHELYGSAMLRVIVEWPISCEHNLTDVHQNRLAWVGHAACCLVNGFPEWITRSAWGFLNQNQQDYANQKARDAVKAWEKMHAKKIGGLGSKMGVERLRVRNSRRSSAAIGAVREGSELSTCLLGNLEKRRSPSQPWLHPTEVWGVHGTEEN